MLAPEIVANEVRRAPEGFNARFSATAREYRYRIDPGPWPDPFEARFVLHRPGGLAGRRGCARRLGRSSASTTSPRSAGGRSRAGRSGGSSGLSIAERRRPRRDHGARERVPPPDGARARGNARRRGGRPDRAHGGREDPGGPDGARTPQMAPAHGLTLERVVYGQPRPATDLTHGAPPADHLPMDVLLPRTLDEALDSAPRPEAVPIAGGTDVMVELNFDRDRPRRSSTSRACPSSTEWRREDGHSFLGAGVTYSRIMRELRQRRSRGVPHRRVAADPQRRHGRREHRDGLAGR